MRQEQLREAISDMSVQITNKWMDISPVVRWANWVDDESNIVSISNPAFGIISDGKSIQPSNIEANGTRIKTVTVGATTKVSKSLLNKNGQLHDRVVRAFAISTARAISNVGYFGNKDDSTIPTITSTGTVKEYTDTIENVGMLELIEMYKKLDPTSLSGAVFEVSKQVRDNIINSKDKSELVTFSGDGGRLYVCGLPVYVNEDFSETSGILAALVNPFDVFTRCTFFEDGIQSLSEINATSNQQTFLSVFDTCSVVDQKDHAIILKVSTPTTIKKTTKKEAR